MQEYRCLNCGNIWAAGHPATQEPEKDVPSCPECVSLKARWARVRCANTEPPKYTRKEE